jgi:carbamoyl-phosphate synthase large subunit
MIRIMFTGGGGAGNEALWRVLGSRYELHFGDADSLAIDPSIPEDRRHQLPWASDSDFVPKMADLCLRLNIDLLVPGVDEELVPLARNVESLAPTRLLLPVSGYVETMLDKLRMIESLAKRQIPVPRSCTLADDIDGLRFPCIAKPRSGRGSRDVRVLNSAADAISLRSTLGDAAVMTLLQDKIEGVEYTVQMAAGASGRLHAIVPVRVGVKRGITIRAETDAEPRVIAACRAIHQAIPAAGCYNIQLMLTSDGQILPFEINPRVSTTLCLVVAAGVDPIAIFLGRACSDDLLPFVAGIRLRRHWTNHFSKDIEI